MGVWDKTDLGQRGRRKGVTTPPLRREEIKSSLTAPKICIVPNIEETVEDPTFHDNFLSLPFFLELLGK